MLPNNPTPEQERQEQLADLIYEWLVDQAIEAAASRRKHQQVTEYFKQIVDANVPTVNIWGTVEQILGDDS